MYPYSKLLRAIKRNEYEGLNPSLSMFVNPLNSSNHLNYTINFLPKWLLYLLIATLARSHQNDFPS